MEDYRIVDLYWQRNEDAISETALKYEKYLNHISYQIIMNTEDAKECVNDTYLRAWQSMPPQRPTVLSTFLGKITRRLSIDKWRASHAGKRSDGEVSLVIDELADCIPDGSSVEMEIEVAELADLINSFIHALSITEKRIFICRYWYFDSVSSISKQFGFSNSKVKSILHRTRGKLLTYPRKGGYIL